MSLEKETAVRIWKSNVKAQQLLKEQEKLVFGKLLKLVANFNNTNKDNNLIVCPQVNISSFADFKDEDKALYEFNKLSVDFLIIDKATYEPLMAIEYYGGGHYPNKKDYKEYKDYEIEHAKTVIRDLSKQILCYKINIELQIICFQDIFYYDENKQGIEFNENANMVFQNISEKLEKIRIGEVEILKNELNKADEIITYLKDRCNSLSYDLDEAEKYIADLENKLNQTETPF